MLSEPPKNQFLTRVNSLSIHVLANILVPHATRSTESTILGCDQNANHKKIKKLEVFKIDLSLPKYKLRDFEISHKSVILIRSMKLKMKIKLDTKKMSLNFEINAFEIPGLRLGSVL